MRFVLLLGLVTPLWGFQADPLYDTFLRSETATLPASARLLIDVRDLSRTGHPVIEVAAQSFSRAAHVVTDAPRTNAWDVQFQTPNTIAPIRRGDVIFGVYHVRCAEASGESASCQASLYLQRSANPWTGLYSSGVIASGRWEKRYFRAVAEQDFPAGAVNLTFHTGMRRQTFEFGGVAAWNLGSGIDLSTLPVSSVSYEGREAGARWRAVAKARIEQHRKAPLRVRVVDAATGEPVPGARVRFRMQRHAYGFGTFLEGPTLAQTRDGERYRQVVLEYFNRGTTPIYNMDGWGWPNPEVRQRYLALAKWGNDNGLTLRAHPLIWPSWTWTTNTWKSLSPDALRTAIRTHFAEVADRLKDVRLDVIDTVNEPRAEHTIIDLLGMEDFAGWFKEWKRLRPEVRTAINEYGIISGGGENAANHDKYESTIRDLLRLGAPVEVIGMQCHMDEAATSPEQIWRVLDRFAALNIPIHATEFDVLSEDTEFQGDYTRDFLTAWFAHPATEAITFWGFWEGEMWRPGAALFRKDWSTKPNGRAYRDLVLGEWWTDETAVTGADGTASTRAFLGDYRIEVAAGRCPAASTPATLRRDSGEITIRWSERRSGCASAAPRGAREGIATPDRPGPRR